MKEDLLQFIWKHQLFDHSNLFAANKETIEIVKSGNQNSHAGPDFSDARIKIGETLWAGNVEIHVRSSEWFDHKHQFDPAYKNVILHVVLINDLELEKEINDLPPLLELHDKINPKLVIKYNELSNNRLWIPCQQNLPLVRNITKTMFQQRLVIERLESRYDYIMEIITRNQYDWYESFHQYMSKSFGFSVNAEPFEQLAQRTPLKILAKHKNDLFQLESILFGQAGMLQQEFLDDYPKELKKEYIFLQKKYNFQPMSGQEWKFARMRPGNFPTLRIAQYAALLNNSLNLFSSILETDDLKEIYSLLSAAASKYWNIHYVFDKPARDMSLKSLGESSEQIITIDTLIPFIFVYGKEKRMQHYVNKAIRFLENSKPEQNTILDKWEERGFENRNAADSQSLLHLKKNYCNRKKCLDCPIGNDVLKFSFD